MMKRTLPAILVALVPPFAFAQQIPDYGLGFVTIGDPGNAAYDGRFND